MTAALIALVLLVGTSWPYAIRVGEGDGYGSTADARPETESGHLRLLQLAGAHMGWRELRDGGIGGAHADERPTSEARTDVGGFSLRVYGLSADGIATPRPGQQPIPVEPEPTPTQQVSTPVSWSIEDIVCSYDWVCWEAISVATCESGLNPRAVNPSSGTLGLFQLHPRFHTWRFHGGDPFDPSVNTAAAYSLYEETNDWRHWSCKP